MKKILTIFIVLVSFQTLSQEDTLSTSYYGGFTLEYGQKFFNSDFNGNLKSINNIELNSLPVEMFSICYSSNLAVSKKFSFPAYMKFSFIIPSQIILDSNSQTLRGFNFNWPVYGQTLINKKYFGLFVSQGVQVGRLKLVNDENRKMKNMTIAPYVGVVAKINISKICVTFISQYDFDISSTIWKKQWFHKGQDIAIGGLRQSGLTFSVGMGWNFGG